MQDDTAFVVGLVAVAAAGPFDLLDHPVGACGAGVGHPCSQERLDLRPPRLHGLGQAGRLGHVGDQDRVVEGEQRLPGAVSVATSRNPNRLGALAVPPSHPREIGAGRELRCDPALLLRMVDEMQSSVVPRAVTAAMSIASSLDLIVDDAIVLHDSNKLTLRLLPCDVLARVAPVAHQIAGFEVDLARRLAESGCPVAALEPRVEPRVYERDGFVVTLWTYYEPVTSREVSPAGYAHALERLHAGMRTIDVQTPHFTDRVESAQQLLASRDRTPALADADRRLLGDTLRSLSRVIGDRGSKQVLHGEPHPGNVLSTRNGLVFIDLETCCRGPVEFDLAHAPEEVGEHYPGVNPDLLRECRILVLAMITTWRWDAGDQLPNGRQLATDWLGQVRAALDRSGLNTHG